MNLYRCQQNMKKSYKKGKGVVEAEAEPSNNYTAEQMDVDQDMGIHFQEEYLWTSLTGYLCGLFFDSNVFQNFGER
ncbi:uncharacterized protein LOC132060510 isoform X2 [Lycium ferocissimum]|uniref:uncharacterized protein LOC132060510 isoform X2 n=1 Tax=Lycium ferocissimum TaxID=112874 RepID=UPI00281534B2|nr:uncharacterized protein LOC132060510 isoform X2 [Lycium ferocissimum]